MNRTRSDFQIERTWYNRPGSTRLHRSSEDRWFLVFTVSRLKKNGENWRSFERLRKDGEKGEGKKRKVEKRIFREIGSRITCARRSRIKGGPNVFSRPGTRRVHPLFTLCVPTWPVKTAFNSSQFTRLLRKEERNPEDVRRPAPGIERNSEWLFAVP